MFHRVLQVGDSFESPEVPDAEGVVIYVGAFTLSGVHFPRMALVEFDDGSTAHIELRTDH